MILKTDQKKHHYLHVVYPWNDSTSQPGLWETVAQAYWNLKRQTAEETYIWTDFTPEEVQIGRASCRERVEIAEGGGTVKRKRRDPGTERAMLTQREQGRERREKTGSRTE